MSCIKSASKVPKTGKKHGQTDGQTDRTKLIVALHNFANISKTHIRNTHKWNETLATWCLIINSSSTTTEISVFHGMWCFITVSVRTHPLAHCPEPDTSSHHHHKHTYDLPNCAWVCPLVSSLPIFWLTRNDIWWRAELTKLLITQFFALGASCTDASFQTMKCTSNYI